MKKVILLYVLLLLCGSCGLFYDKDCWDNNDYIFYLPFTLYSAQDTFKVNDTIHLQANFSDLMLDSNSLKSYRVVDHPLFCYFGISQIGPPDLFIATSYFTFISDTGLVFPNSSGELRYIQYLYEEKRYKLDLKIIPTIKGLFKLGIAAQTFQSVDLQERCPSETIQYIYFNLNNGAENNYHFLELSIDSFQRNYPQSDFNRSGSYCFRVVE